MSRYPLSPEKVEISKNKNEIKALIESINTLREEIIDNLIETNELEKEIRCELDNPNVFYRFSKTKYSSEKRIIL